MHDQVERHFDVLRTAVGHGGGEVFATMGDGIAAAFPSADAAVQAAISAQRDMPPIGLKVRMGVHTGEVERFGDDFRGRPVNRAGPHHGGRPRRPDPAVGRDGGARALGAQPGGVRRPRHPRLRDLAEPERVWQVVHPDLPRHFPPVRGPRHLRQQPADPALVAGRPRPRRGPRHRTRPGNTGSSRSPASAASARPGSPCRPPPTCCREFADVWFVELASVADPDDVADAIALTMGLGGRRPIRWRRPRRCWPASDAALWSTTASTSSTAPRP